MERIKKGRVLTFIVILSFTLEYGQNVGQNNTGLISKQRMTNTCTQGYLANTASCKILAILEKESCLRLDKSFLKILKNQARSSLAEPNSPMLSQNKTGIITAKENLTRNYTSEDAIPSIALNPAPTKFPLNIQLKLLESELALCRSEQKAPKDLCSEFNVKQSKADVAFGTFFILVTIIGICGNVTVLLIIGNDKQLRSQAINWFLFSLAISDIIVCSSIVPFRAHESFHNQISCISIRECYVLVYTDHIATVSSIISLVYISINRYIAVSRPTKFSSCISRKKTVIMIFCCWCFAVILSILPTINWKTGKSSITYYDNHCFISNVASTRIIFLTLVVLMPLIIMGILYLSILCIIKQRGRKCQDKSRKYSMQYTEWKVTRIVTIVYGVFFSAWLPNYIINVIVYLCPECYWILKEKHSYLYIILMQCLPPMSSAINPFIYFFIGERYREALRKIFKFEREGSKYETEETPLQEHGLMPLSKENAL